MCARTCVHVCVRVDADGCACACVCVQLLLSMADQSRPGPQQLPWDLEVVELGLQYVQFLAGLFRPLEEAEPSSPLWHDGARVGVCAFVCIIYVCARACAWMCACVLGLILSVCMCACVYVCAWIFADSVHTLPKIPTILAFMSANSLPSIILDLGVRLMIDGSKPSCSPAEPISPTASAWPSTPRTPCQLFATLSLGSPNTASVFLPRTLQTLQVMPCWLA